MLVNTLLIGIKRGLFRANDPRVARADAEFAAKRDAAKAAGRYRCIHCAWESRKHCQVHHLDDNHHNNDPGNFGVVDQECHAYHHVGEPSKLGGDKSNVPDVTGRTMVCAIPELSAQDLNLLMRAMSIAYATGGEEAKIAQEIHQRLARRHEPVKVTWGSAQPADFAAAMAQLTDAEYAGRPEAVEPLRVVFRAAYMPGLAARTKDDSPIMRDMRDWAGVARNVEDKCAA